MSRPRPKHEKITPEMVLYAYSIGVFPMADPDGQIHWYSPDPRAVFDLDRVRVPRTLRQTIRRCVFEVRVNTAFTRVIDACGKRPEGTWISPQIRRLYTSLHHMGFAHSVEAWRGGRLAGGLYGVALGGAFFGESMFHRVTDASKVALVALVERLGRRGFVLLDTQWLTPHLERFGAHEIPREEYLRRLKDALDRDCRFAD
jgi:leucyl/phenylalanyl-tRNA--protein transferase